jgi:xylan 1,4-beta-xylosidase
LIRWDRVQRPGLLHYGDKDAPAEFAYFKMKNLK